MLRREPIASAPHFFRRSAAFLFFLALILGLTFQAMYLPPLRGSRSHDNFSSGLDTTRFCPQMTQITQIKPQTFEMSSA